MQYKESKIQNTEYKIRNTCRATRGITLVEIIVSVGLFAIVMFVMVGALLSLTGANRKAQALQSVMNNLNIALDSMVRSIRVGSDYHCGSQGIITEVSNCPNNDTGDTVFAFKPFCDDDNCNPNNRWIYFFDLDTGRIKKSENGVMASGVPITSPEVTIEKMKFYVIGTEKGDSTQPKVVITIEGTAGGTNVKTKTTFNIQATAVQRILDL